MKSSTAIKIAWVVAILAIVVWVNRRSIWPTKRPATRVQLVEQSSEKLEGEWRHDCAAGHQYTSFTSIKTFTAGEVVEKRTGFEKECREALIDIEWRAHYTVGEGVTEGGHRPIDYTSDAIRFTALTGPMASLLNDNKECGFSDWKANEARDILGAGCLAKWVSHIGPRAYDLFHITGDEVAFGTTYSKDIDGTTPEKRYPFLRGTLKWRRVRGG